MRVAVGDDPLPRCSAPDWFRKPMVEKDRAARSTKLQRIDERRREALIAQATLTDRAGVSRSLYLKGLAGQRTLSWPVLNALEKAVRSLQAGREQDVTDALLRCTANAAVLAVAAKLGLDGPTLLAVDPRGVTDKNFADASRVRKLAAYLVVTGTDVTMESVALALGVTKQASSKWMPQVEDMRDDPAIDAMLNELADALQVSSGW